MPLLGQTSLNLTNYLVRDENAFNSRYASKAYINNSSVYVEQRASIKSLQLSAYYNPDFLFYSNQDKLNNRSHLFGVSGVYSKDAYILSLSSSAKWRNYQEPYNFYNVNSFLLNANLQYCAKLSQLLQAGLTIKQDQYKNYSDLSNQTYKVYAKYQLFFKSRTSLTGELGWGVKNYFNQSFIEYFGMGYGVSTSARVRENAVRASLLSAGLTIGKSLLTRTGLSLSLGGQWFLGDPIMTYTGGIYYFTENDLYDDPYSYQGRYGSIELTRQFAVDFQAKAGVKIQRKDYQGTPALDINGWLSGSMRHDQREEYFLMVSKKFTTGWNIPSSISLFVNLMYRNNASNDPYFSYHDQIGLIGLSFGLLNPGHRF